MMINLLLCLVWVGGTAAFPRLNSADQSTTAYTSVIPEGPAHLQGRATAGNQTCIPDPSTSFNEMVAAYVPTDEFNMETYLTSVLKESNMTLGGHPHVSSEPADPSRVFCDFFAKANDSVGTTFPACLMETAINSFCSVKQTYWMNSTGPFQTDSKGGAWVTYKFTGFATSGLYVGVEFSKSDDCKTHKRAIYPNGVMPDRHCQDKLMGAIVNTCQGDSQYFKRGGVATDFCEIWAVYPLPPFQNATGGQTSISYAAPSPSPAYPLCQTTLLAGDLLVADTTKPSTATVTPPSSKSDFGGPGATTFTATKRAASIEHHLEGSASSATITSSVPITTDIFETSKPGPAIPAGPGRRQITRV